MTDAHPAQKLRLRLALPVGENAVFDGWTRTAVDSAAAQLGIDPAQARLAFPGGPHMIDAWIDAVDAAMAAHFPPEKIAAMKIRDRIRSLVWFRLETRPRRARRCAGRSRSSPCRKTCRSRLKTGWRAADLMWRIAGDTATDFNHYTKRLTLVGGLRLDPARLARRRERGLGRHRRLPRPPPRRRHAVREMEGPVARQRHPPPQPGALPRPVALPGQ